MKMYDNHLLDDMVEKANLIDESTEETEVIDLAGYQVTKAELFSHTREPAVTVWCNRLKFNMACLRRFPGVTHIQILIHPEQEDLLYVRVNQMHLIRCVGRRVEAKRTYKTEI